MMKRYKVVPSPRWCRCALFLVAAGAWFGLTAMPTFAATDSGPCWTNAESRQLDYWLGQWTVTVPGASGTSTSDVSLSLDKCLVVEIWDGGKGHTGENMFAYSADDMSWHGMFADNLGHVHVFVDGKVAAGSAEFSGPSRGPNGEAILNRIRIVRVGANKVEQTWEKSTDNGATWATVFHGEYSRRRP